MRSPAACALVLLGTLACAAPAPSVATPGPSPTGVPVPTAAPTAASAQGTIVDAGEQYFEPPVLTVPVGTSVLWRDVQGTHDVVATDGTFASAVMFEGGTYSFTFTRPGRYRYVCTLHEGAGMWAEVVVEAS
jgi:plastocyanin